MNEVVTTTAISATTGILGWFFSKMQTRRERRKEELALFNAAITEAISPLLESINKLTEQNRDVVGKLLCEQDKNLALIEEKRKLLSERMTLTEKVEKLEKQIKTLNGKINELIKIKEA